MRAHLARTGQAVNRLLGRLSCLLVWLLCVCGRGLSSHLLQELIGLVSCFLALIAAAQMFSELCVLLELFAAFCTSLKFVLDPDKWLVECHNLGVHVAVVRRVRLFCLRAPVVLFI